MRLLDVNVLLANCLEAHEQHLAVRAWFRRNPAMPFATCALTEISLIRLLMNPAIHAEPMDAATGMELLGHLHRHSLHRYLDRLPSPHEPEVDRYLSRIHGYRQVTDAYLLAIAIAHGGKLATFDRKLASLFGVEALEFIEPT